MASVALLANGRVGVWVAEYLRSIGDEIAFLCLHNPELQKSADHIRETVALDEERIRLADDFTSGDAVELLHSLQPDFLITVYWAHLLKPEAFGAAKMGSVNFHPAPLPVNRGWYPHVHSFLDGSPFGVTLHQIDEGADTGPIWAQRIIEPASTDTAGSIHARLEEEIFSLFQETWPSIRTGELKPTPQNEEDAVYHKKAAVDPFDHCDLDALTAREFLARLRARTFHSRGFAYFLDEDEKRVYMNLRLSHDSLFE